MSGICGIWSPQVDARQSRAVQTGLHAMEHRGRQGFSIYPDRNVALGHCLFDTGCNGLWVDADGFAISFDGRIDNRDALSVSLRKGAADAPVDLDRLSDQAFLLFAFRQVKERLPAMLRGDFALAIWNPAEEALFLCRDHFGVRPLFYRWVGPALHFASEIKGLRAMVGGPELSVRYGAASGFVSGEPDLADDPARTFYEDVFRLLPGHFAIADKSGWRTSRYWRLDPPLPAGGDHSPRFRELLIRAIGRRTRSTQPLGALLSGGLDSSAIVSLIGSGAAGANAQVFSLTFDAEDEDETPYIDAVVQAYDLPAAKIDGSCISALHAIDEIMEEQDHPPPAPNAALSRHLLHQIAGRGIRVVLHGHGGDEVVSHGRGLFQELAESGRWIRLWRSLAASRNELGPPWPHFRKLVRQKGLRGWRTAARAVLGRTSRSASDPVLFAPDGRRRPIEQSWHLRTLTAPLFARALEITDHEAAAAGVEVRMPFLDIDLVEFCVTVPAEQKWADGYPRALLRKALAGVLPARVAQRRDKFDFVFRLGRSLLHDHADMIGDALGAKAGWLAPHADVPLLRSRWHALQQGRQVDGRDLMAIWRAVVLSRWLQRESGREAGESRLAAQASR